MAIARLARRLTLAAMLAVLGGYAATPAAADGSPFALDGFAAVAPGTTLAFRHLREIRPEGEPPRAVFEEGLELAVAAAEAGGVEVRVTAEGRAADAQPAFAAEVGHPMLLLFLESTVRTMAAATGGSPDYIRVRLREALWRPTGEEAATALVDGEAVAARRLAYRPFAEDPHRDAMGPFAGMEVAFLLADDVPGGIVAFSAETEPGEGDFPGLFETIVLDTVTTAE
jgi:hypothetical protein